MKNKKIFYGILIFIAISIFSIFIITKVNQNGLKTRLVPLEQQYSLGQPMKFRLEMTNVGASTIMYDSQQVGVNNAMIIKDQNGKISPYIAGSFQTGGGPKPIQPKEIVILFYQFDITSQYYIGKPGRYTVQFRGQDTAFGEESLPPSNIVEIDVQPATLTTTDIFIGRLLDIIPNQWDLTKGLEKYIEVDGICAQMDRIRAKGGKEYIMVCQTYRLINLSSQGLEYLGKNQWGYVYISIQPEAETLWPNVREQIIKALEITQM